MITFVVEVVFHHEVKQNFDFESFQFPKTQECYLIFRIIYRVFCLSPQITPGLNDENCPDNYNYSKVDDELFLFLFSSYEFYKNLKDTVKEFTK